ncbi:kinase-associated lipoprotein B [Paenibacillus sp. J5C_2022]|uniref:kinase-associated lipoprotein B n=1 Tax=Paenibacillus sp. J5C2022 TaxID=2977129 RepID=UPI0021CF3316|nr:kinase-associated lipoprotein B [Paenibacillus sp. J5C2022]MCU6709185.1 kinase-associated lipoprotein B [Paenibacillus sp. J5C2022]
MMTGYERDEWAIGDIVQAEVRSGRYVGEVVELNGPRAVVKVLAVLKHPEQGDLHQPYNPDAVMFHERRALSYTEKTTVLKRDIQPYRADVPDYRQSLHSAVAADIEALERMNRWTAKSVELLKQLQQEYQ